MALDFPVNPINGQVYDNFYYDSSMGTWRAQGSGLALNAFSDVTITDSAATKTPLTVKGYASQSANLQSWKNSSDTEVLSVSPLGELSSTYSVAGGPRAYFRNTNSGSDQYTYGLALANDVGTKGVHFVNSSARTADGGANSYTVRNDGGPFNLGGSGYVTSISGSQVNLPSQTYMPGAVVQVKASRTDARTTFAFSGDTIIGDISIGITPKFATSLLVVQYMLSFECTYNAVFRAFRDNGLIYTGGYQGYNNTDGNSWSGIAVANYDNDLASTPQSQFIQYIVPANSTAATTLQLAVRCTDGGTPTFYLNRSISSSGTTAYEVMISNVTVWEIAQ